MSNSANLRPRSALRALARLNRVEAADESPEPNDFAAEDPEQSDLPEEDLGGDLPDMVPDEEDPAEAEDVDDGDEAFTIDDVIKCFLRANPNPTDEQVHAFADLMDMSYEEFEAQIFKKFGEVIRQATSIGPSESEDDVEVEGESEDAPEAELDVDAESDTEPEIEADDSLDVQDDVDMFVIAYMLFNPEPSDDQIHKLAFVVDLTREQMEERIYRMLANYIQVDDGSSDEDSDSGSADDTDTQDDQDDQDEQNDQDKEDEDTDSDPETSTDDQGE